MPLQRDDGFDEAPQTVLVLAREIEQMSAWLAEHGESPDHIILHEDQALRIIAAAELAERRGRHWWWRLWWRMQDAWDVTGMELRQWLVHRGR